ncbi:hypothetical protein Q5424_03860 [Conexibacter sp. JD483]|uniref:hypothetical protein n=1 Tax=unclassified Conexibacter TaxID=2627773 RepID=UPI002716CE0F|nr:MULTISPECIES: hypothetical protein [unclassified Conexibacter]MDO8186225.1 hypothetical protein [Conexibacter sp. CPCC 205706]MDO8199708.1 hypothetical protein [Conexibacter sp. CPCC 205762]MDR9368200.1 hypothetical protein [Conexibacter sp. JD483]
MSATASSASTAVVSPAPLIWPERDNHTITAVDLAPAITANVEPLLPQLRQLSALGDALRSLQALDGGFTNEAHARVIAGLSADLMDELADSDPVSPEQAELIRRRAAALRELKHDTDIANTEAALIDAQELSIIASPVCTFRNKTRTPLHSVIVTAAHEQGNELIAGLDASSDAVLEEVNGYTKTSDVTADSPFAMQITDLITMGGESNAFPKHFCYFLPEDEGAGFGEQSNKTILMRNVYGLRYEHISKVLGDRLLNGHKPGDDVDIPSVLITWMRGHDIAHAVTTPRAGKVGPKDVGHEPWYSLQEAIADAFGTAMSFTQTWLDLAGCTADDLAAVYIAEALHYLRRGPWNWSDAGAACVELSFLAGNGYIDVAEDGTVTWETARVIEGVHALCATLEREVVSAPAKENVQAILDQYGWREDSPIAPTVRKIRDELAGIPTSLAYL